MNSMGIDPGMEGYICLLSRSQAREDLRFWAMPVRPGDRGGEEVDLDVERLLDLFREVGGILDILVVEQQQGFPGSGPRCPRCHKHQNVQGVASTFKTGKNYGVLVGAARALGLPLVVVEPDRWKPLWGLSWDKALSTAKARFLSPSTDFRALERTPLARKPDHNKAEAYILAKHGVRLLEQGKVVA